VKYGDTQLDFFKMERPHHARSHREVLASKLGSRTECQRTRQAGTPRALGERHYPAKEKMSDGEWTGLLFEMLAERQAYPAHDPLRISYRHLAALEAEADDPSVTERFEIYVAGMEVANGFSELNDPAEQERRFLAQMAQGGDEVPKQL